MARLYALGLRLRCPVCGVTSAIQHAAARCQKTARCAACGTTVELSSDEMKREVTRVERDWARLWEHVSDQAEPLG